MIAYLLLSGSLGGRKSRSGEGSLSCQPDGQDRRADSLGPVDGCGVGAAAASVPRLPHLQSGRPGVPPSKDQREAERADEDL